MKKDLAGTSGGSTLRKAIRVFAGAGAVLPACAMLLAAAEAAAETYRVLEGELGAQPGGEAPLSGTLELRLHGFPLVQPPAFSQPLPLVRPTVLLVDDFALQAGSQDFAPDPPVEHAGRTPTLTLEIADQIVLDRSTGAVDLLRLRSGGELVAADAEQVTFRFLELRSQRDDGGSAEGPLADTGLPKRLVLQGTLHEVDQTFRIDDCPILVQPPDLRPPGGGGAIISFPEFDIPPLEEVQFTPPEGGSIAIGRVTGQLGGAGSIVGGYQPPEVGSLLLVAPELAVLAPDSATRVVAPASLARGIDPAFGRPSFTWVDVAPDLDVSTPGFQALSQPPTLEELGITAPDGAEVTLAQGEVTVATSGDLFVAGGPIDIDGLTKLILVAGGGIYVEGDLSLPPGVGLSLQAGAEVVVDGTILPGDPPGEITVDVEPVVVCPGLRALWPPQEREVGRFRLVAAATQAVDVRVKARRGRVLPWQQRPLAVAVLGSEDLDVGDVLADSLRLGSGAAEALRTRRRDVDGDGRPDLVARFDVSAAGIALGDHEVCLVGELSDGSAIEGCDAIRTWPRWMRPQAPAD